MEIAINEAKGKLSGLIKAAAGGERVLLTNHGRPVAEIKSLSSAKTPIEKLSALKRIAAKAALKGHPGPDAVHSADFLYDDTGLPK